MSPFRLTIKNFRCFSDENPVVMEIAPGYTAFIGPNNSGKSSILRLFFELRYLWGHLIDSALHNIIMNPIIGLGTGTIQDPDEVFTNLNRRDIELKFELLGGQETSLRILSRLTLTFDRQSPWVISFKMHDQDGKIITHEGRQPINRSGAVLDLTSGALNVDAMEGVMRAIRDSFFIGAFRNAINQGAGPYYDLQVGTALVSMWNVWKVGSTRANTDKVLEVTETIREMFGYRSLEINASADGKNLLVVVNRRSYTLAELGSGLAQFIIVLANVAIRNPSIIFIDEPELNLHPSLQERFLMLLSTYSASAVVFATHSIGLARSAAKNIYSFRKIGDAAQVHRLESSPHYAEMMGELSFASYQELGYEKVLMVEGTTDAPLFRQFLRLLGVDHKVMVISLGGSQLARGHVEEELTELKRLTPNLVAVVDSERLAKDQPANSERLAFETACKAVNIPILLTERRATENYLSERAIREVFGSSQRAFEPYETRDEVKPSWRKDENWKAAAKMNLTELMETDVGQFLKKHLVFKSNA